MTMLLSLVMLVSAVFGLVTLVVVAEEDVNVVAAGVDEDVNIPTIT
jgi:hypothetical protein